MHNNNHHRRNNSYLLRSDFHFHHNIQNQHNPCHLPVPGFHTEVYQAPDMIQKNYLHFDVMRYIFRNCLQVLLAEELQLFQLQLPVQMMVYNTHHRIPMWRENYSSKRLGMLRLLLLLILVFS